MVKCVIGVDEVGRGPIAGPVTVCAVSIPIDFNIKKLNGVRDSKQMKEHDREAWFKKAHQWRANGDIGFCVASISASFIDAYGIEKATQRAIQRVLQGVRSDEVRVLLDGRLSAPKRFLDQETIIKGDQKEVSISFASVIAKVHRDRYMKKQALKYPGYGLESHKGYGTKKHYEAIQKQGISPLHRRSFIHI